MNLGFVLYYDPLKKPLNLASSQGTLYIYMYMCMVLQPLELLWTSLEEWLNILHGEIDQQTANRRDTKSASLDLLQAQVQACKLLIL